MERGQQQQPFYGAQHQYAQQAAQMQYAQGQGGFFPAPVMAPGPAGGAGGGGGGAGGAGGGSLQTFWREQQQECAEAEDFKNHQLPLARIKKIMKSDEDVRMISAEAPILFAKACEMFILELTIRSWSHSEENKRRTLQRNDIAAAITKTDIFDFLVDIIPRDDMPPGAAVGAGPPGEDDTTAAEYNA